MRFTLDNELFQELKENYEKNIKSHLEQVTGVIIENKEKVYEEQIIRFIENTLGTVLADGDYYVDRKFIEQHFDNFNICPVMENLRYDYFMKADLVPDVNCVSFRP